MDALKARCAARAEFKKTRFHLFLWKVILMILGLLPLINKEALALIREDKKWNFTEEALGRDLLASFEVEYNLNENFSVGLSDIVTPCFYDYFFDSDTTPFFTAGSSGLLTGFVVPHIGLGMEWFNPTGNNFLRLTLYGLYFINPSFVSVGGTWGHGSNVTILPTIGLFGVWPF